ncbi:MAG: dTMP kinase, partial [Desulfuromonadales bacterium]|nr:dTMP kinase [Desulfuromonadales bacterium]NIS39573.1 dTMP kinase [Desulfuromonadales bacterium]
GSGKTTQIRLLAERLHNRGIPVLSTREPGGCRIADAIRSVLLDSEHLAMSASTELLLYAAARAQHVEEIIRPALAAGKVVLCDRFSDATIAYQGEGRGLDLALIDTLNGVAAQGLTPDLTVLLDMPVEEGLRRAIERNNQQEEVREDRFEQESLRFHQRVREGYLKLVERDDRFFVVDARGGTDEVASRIDRVVAPFLGTRG